MQDSRNGPPWRGNASRRTALRLAAALAAPLAAPGLDRGGWIARARAQDRFPDRPIRLIVPWAAGSSSDVQMRSLAEEAQKPLGQSVVIENRAGAAGTIHAQQLAASRPDGYTLGQMHLGVIRRPFMLRNAGWDAVADFSHIIRLCGWVLGVAIKTDRPWQTWRDYLDHARANPGRVSYSTSGIGTTNHLAMEDLARREKVELVHVPFRGSSEGVTAVLAGQVDSIADASTWAPFVEGGQMRALSVWTAERMTRLPDVPTLKDLGYNMVVSTAYGISGPRGIEPGIVRILHDAFKAALYSPANARVRAQFDMPADYLDSEAFSSFIAQRAVYERTMVQELGLRLD
jgi:tripartite-type tricarboxylate transporter receptor subunit TctC